jgi:hypothetical protein
MIWDAILYFISTAAYWFGQLIAFSILNDVLTGHKRRDDLQSYARRHKEDKR